MFTRMPDETREVVFSYAQRKGWTLEFAEQWLAPVLAYERQ